MKKVLSAIIVAVMLIGMFPAIAIPAFAATSGTTGDCTWTLNGTELTISGTGAMEDYDYIWSKAPWQSSEANITEIVIEHGVTQIGTLAFAGCTGLTTVTIGDGVETIGESAFSGCTNLTSVTIGDSVETIYTGAFSGCTGLEKVYIDDLTAWCKIIFWYSIPLGGGVPTCKSNPLFYADQLYVSGTLTENLVIPDGVTTIEDCVFFGCSYLKSVTIPDSVKVIGELAFYGCNGLNSITIPKNITDILNYAFYDCTGLTNIILPKSLATVENNAFSNCNSLKNVQYAGTQLERSYISIANGNSYLHQATWTYGACTGGHSYTNACDIDCNDCGAVRKAPHVFDYECSTVCLVCEAECYDCGAGRDANHIYDNACDKDCNICKAIRTPAAHKGGTATCKEKAKCSVCGVAYGNLAAHKFGGYVYNDDATSQKDGTQTRTCSVCKKTETVTAAGTKLQNPFKDVKLDQYYAEPVLWAVGKNITNGMTANTFAPNNDCTRGQIVTFLWRAAGSPEPKSTRNPFKDVKSNQYYYKAVLWAVEKGITNGTSANTFSPDATCTRAQVVTFLWRAKGSPKVSATNPFKDVKKSYYSDAVLWAVKNNITTGTSATTFSPDATCTRGQIVTFLYRAYK